MTEDGTPLPAQLAELRAEITVLRREVATSTEATAAVRNALLAQIGARFEAINAAVQRIEHVMDQRFELVNQFRTQLTADARAVMPRGEIEAALGRLDSGLEDVTQRLTAAEGRSAGASTLWAHIVAGVGLLLAIIAAVLAYTNNQRINEETPAPGVIAPIIRLANPVYTPLSVGP
jgi:hypothetical protein